MFNWWFHGRQVECGYAHCALLPYVGHFHDMLQLCKNWRDLEEKEKSGPTKSDRKNHWFGPQKVVLLEGKSRFFFQKNLGESERFLDLLARKVSLNHWFQEKAGLLPLGKFTKVPKRKPDGLPSIICAGVFAVELPVCNKNRVPKAIKKRNSLGWFGWLIQYAGSWRPGWYYMFNYVWLNLETTRANLVGSYYPENIVYHYFRQVVFLVLRLRVLSLWK